MEISQNFLAFSEYMNFKSEIQKKNRQIVEVKEFKLDLRRDVAPFFSMSIRGNTIQFKNAK